jgi:hypothetical protein
MGLKSRRRYDHGTLGDVEVTPQGGLSIPAFLTRAGVFDYEQDDGTVIREYRPPEEVFKNESLATLSNAPLCNEHPPEPVRPDNFQRYSVGHVENGSIKQDSDKVAARLIFQRKDAIADIQAARKREISCGYECDVDETSGIAEEGRYDQIQRNIRYNHVALVPDGRAGPEIRLRLDSKGNQTTQEQMHMEKEYETIGGTRYEVGSDAHRAALKQRDQRRLDSRKVRKDLKAQLAKQTGRADALESRIKKLEAALKNASSPQRLDHAVKVRGAVIRRAQVALGAAFKMDGLSVPAIKLLAVKKYFPDVKTDGKGKSTDFINGMFRAIPSDKNARQDAGGMRLDANNRIDGGRIPAHLREAPRGFAQSDSNGRGPSMDDYRQRRNDAEEDRHRRPLAVTKQNPHREVDGYPAVQGSMLENMR